MADKTVIGGSNVSALQLREIFDQIADGVLKRSHLQALIEHRNPFAVGEKDFFNPQNFFSRPCVCTDGFDFLRDNILSKIGKSMPYRGIEGMTSSVLSRRMRSNEMIKKLWGGVGELRKYAFTIDQVAMMIDCQANGEDGDLLNNGNNNLFPVSTNGVLFVFSAYWRLSKRTWYVMGSTLDEYTIHGVGSKIFRNTILQV